MNDYVDLLNTLTQINEAPKNGQESSLTYRSGSRYFYWGSTGENYCQVNDAKNACEITALKILLKECQSAGLHLTICQQTEEDADGSPIEIILLCSRNGNIIYNHGRGPTLVNALNEALKTCIKRKQNKTLWGQSDDPFPTPPPGGLLPDD